MSRRSEQKWTSFRSLYRRRFFCFLMALLLFTNLSYAWEWSDFVSGGVDSIDTDGTKRRFLSIEEVSELRVRDIKWRLARHHGYSAEELGQMLDKKELIHALAFEEEKIRLQQEAEAKRQLAQQGIMAAIFTIIAIFCWPLLQHAFEVASVNFVVYTDRKRYEASRCRELKSFKGLIGVLVMGILDVLQVWLTASVLLSWVTTSKYFFPVPRLTVRPAQMMGGEMAKSNLANYGINMGSMLVTWILRYSYGKIEYWTGKALSEAHRKQRREARQWETAEEKTARKAAKKAAKLEKQQRKQQQHQGSASSNQPNQQLPPDWMQPTEEKQLPQDSATHEEFLQQLNEHTSEMDDLD